jgi:hypothetical protein
LPFASVASAEKGAMKGVRILALCPDPLTALTCTGVPLVFASENVVVLAVPATLATIV